MDPCVWRPRCSSCQLEDIEEEGPANWLSVACVPPETPTESMEFLARSWSLSALELSKALTNKRLNSNVVESAPLCSSSTSTEVHHVNSTTSLSTDKVAMDSSRQLLQQLPAPHPCGGCPPISQRESEDTKFYRSVWRGKAVGRWLKDHREKKQQEIPTYKAQLHAAMLVASVATAVAAFAAATAVSSDTSAVQHYEPSKTSAAIASAAALVASHCIEIAEEMGADRDQILTVVDSAINVRTTGDIMTLTAGAATALRGAATLRARMQKGCQTAAFALADNELDMSSVLNFVLRGGELLKRTRKGALHWKQVSFYINSNWQVVAKMKSKHMVGAFTKKKKCVVSDVYCNIAAWPGREIEEGSEQRAYFGIKTADRLIEFECRSKCNQKMWTDGIRQMLHRHANMM